MADLGNSKIKDTYTLVLQTDGSGNLQNLDGTTPSPFIVNGNLRYVDGSQALNYVLTSDASGNASWSEAGGTSYWSANTDGTISPSGLTTSVGIGTTTPNKPLTVVGDISGTTDLYIDGNMYSGTTNLLDIFATSAITNQDVYWSAHTNGSIIPSGRTTTIQTEGDLRVSGTVYTNNITTTATSTDTLIIQSDMIDFQSHGGSIDYLRVKDDAIQFYLDSLQGVTFHGPSHASPGFIFNASSQDLPFKILADDTTTLFRTYADTNAVHIRDHVMISSTDGFPPLVTGSDWALAVTGSSLFYSGGSSHNTEAIVAVGNISGTTDLYIDANMYSGTTNLLDIFATSAITNQDVYWSANTNGSISTSGGSTNLELGGDISLVDNGEILLGDGGDLSITHNSIKSIIKNTTGELLFENEATDADIRFKGDDDGDTITALTLDMSEAGAANFNSTVTAAGFVGDVTGNADTATKIASITNTDIVQLAGSQTLTGTKTLNSFKGTAGATVTNILDEDAMGSNSATALATQQSIKAYADTKSVIAGNTSLVTVGTVTTGEWASNRKFGVSASDPLGSGRGDIVYLGEETTVPGTIYYYSSLGTWLETDANATSTSTGLLAVALSENSSEGMLLRGMVTLATDTGAIALPVYLSESGGKGTTTIPTTSGAVVRVIGYSMVTATNQIWFNPDNTWVELT